MPVFWRFCRSVSNVTRQLAAIMKAKDARGRLGHLRSVLMGEKKPGFSDRKIELSFRSTLNESQRLAVEFALSAEDLAILPGMKLRFSMPNTVPRIWSFTEKRLNWQKKKTSQRGLLV